MLLSASSTLPCYPSAAPSINSVHCYQQRSQISLWITIWTCLYCCRELGEQVNRPLRVGWLNAWASISSRSVLLLRSVQMIPNSTQINCYNLLGENDTKTEGVLRTRFEKAIQCAPCILFLKHVDALAQTTQVLETGKGGSFFLVCLLTSIYASSDPAIVTALKECMGQAQGSWRTTNFPVVVLGTTSEPSKVPGSILALFKHQISFEVRHR